MRKRERGIEEKEEEEGKKVSILRSLFSHIFRFFLSSNIACLPVNAFILYPSPSPPFYFSFQGQWLWHAPRRNSSNARPRCVFQTLFLSHNSHMVHLLRNFLIFTSCTVGIFFSSLTLHRHLLLIHIYAIFFNLSPSPYLLFSLFLWLLSLSLSFLSLSLISHSLSLFLPFTFIS